MEKLKDILSWFEQYTPLALVLFLVCMVGGVLCLVLGKRRHASDTVIGAGLSASWRDNKSNPLPSADIFTKANREVLITGATCYRTLDQSRKEIIEALEQKKHIYVIFVHPNGKALEYLSKKERQDLKLLVSNSISLIKSSGFLKFPEFKVRFFSDEFPPITGIMVDGDVEPRGVAANNVDGILRMQIRGMFSEQHSGLLQVMRAQSETQKAFDHYSADFRQQWKQAMADEEQFR